MYTRDEAGVVWNGWVQMKTYLKDQFSVFVDSEGIYYTDQKGIKYIDGISNLLTTSLGHKNQYINKKVSEQLNRMDSCSLMYSTSDVSIEYSQRIVNLTNNYFGHVFYTNSGSEAADTAIKIARQYFYNMGQASKTKIISLKGAYHGSTIAAGYANGNQYDIRAFGDSLDSYIQTTPPNILFRSKDITDDEFLLQCEHELEEIIINEDPENIAGIMVELIQLSNGSAVIDKRYFYTIKKLCEKYNILWIVDEVATGFGRTGELFACQHLGIWPDIMMIAKGITNGCIPLGAVLVTDAVFDEFLGSNTSKKELSHGFTTSGHPLACAAALACLDIYENGDAISNVNKNASWFLSNLKKFEEYTFIEVVQGVGYMAGISFGDIRSKFQPDINIGAIASGIIKRFGLLTYYEYGQMFLAPPLICDRDNLTDMLEIMKKAFDFLEKTI